MARDYWVWLYSHIEHWCGNGLTVELADAVSAAPAEQIVAFSQSFDGGPGAGIGERMIAGSLRPLVAPPDFGEIGQLRSFNWQCRAAPMTHALVTEAAP